ncbi:hypothetical protein [Dactylosporangium sp. NPDC051484]|uniref:hypothetical protein n=1 Tax=Dactylosporangium sp. NPDC051484 TaxID=3154942 RepID=UPI00344E2A0E
MEQQRVLAERMAGAGWRVPALLATMPDAPDFYFDSICQVRVDRWSRGRVCCSATPATAGRRWPVSAPA